MALLKEFFSLKKNPSTHISAHVSKFQTILSRLLGTGLIEFHDMVKQLLLLNYLTSEYEPFVTNAELNPPENFTKLIINLHTYVVKKKEPSN